MSGIIWLASYAKSGNTWFRVFLTNLRGERKKPTHINELGSTPIASARGIFDEAAGMESSDLTEKEIDQLRPEIYKHMAANGDDTLFMKVHDAYSYLDKDTFFFRKRRPRAPSILSATHLMWWPPLPITRVGIMIRQFRGSQMKNMPSAARQDRKTSQSASPEAPFMERTCAELGGSARIFCLCPSL